MAWRSFRSGKSHKECVIEFEHNLENNLFALKAELENLSYCHGKYQRFVVHDPKQRIIHKAEVRDRVIHTLAARKLEEIYQGSFIAHSFSCQRDRGTHRALKSVTTMCRRQSCNYTRNFWYLKCDVKKFFDNIDHETLLKILRRKIQDEKFILLIGKILESFCAGAPGRGLPLGNFTSQWLGNIYLNELDYFVKQRLKIKNYVRYADDFVILDARREILEKYLEEIRKFLAGHLKLTLHPDKIILKKFSAGIDWVGYRVLPHHVISKSATAKRLFKKLKFRQKELTENRISPWRYYQTVNSYLGQLKHCAGHKLSNQIIFNDFIYDYAGKIF